jgi:drug/metabolite transporter (DMT)-like permease
LISGVAIGFFFLALARTRTEAGMWPILAARMISTAFFGTLVVMRRESLRMPRPTLGLVLLAGSVDMLANAFYLAAAWQGPLSVVVTLSSLYPASTVLLARIALGERLNTWQITGVGCALTAILLIVSGDR